MLNFKPDKLKTNLLLARWAVLGALVLAVGAVAVWGGAKPEAAPQTKLAEQLQAHIGDDTQPVLPAAAQMALNIPDKPETTPAPEPTEPEAKPEPLPEPEAGDTALDETANKAVDEIVEEETDEVIDEAPEPWVGDELLTVEANLQQMLSPLSGSSGSLRDFGYSYDAVFNDYRFHGAVDLAGSLGAAVVAPLAGTIKEISEDSFYGTSIVLEHDGKLETSYFGLTPQPGLQTGQPVIAGEKLGELCPPPPFENDETISPHLHWEIRLDGEKLDPNNYL